jgi:dTDP-glucose pyrophosphorylase
MVMREHTWEEVLIDSERSILDVMRLLTETQMQITMVVDSNRKLLGVVCDGDIRRALLRGLSLTASLTADSVINASPYTVLQGTPDAAIIEAFEKSKVTRLPILDAAGVVVGLAKLEEFLSPPKRTNPVVVMAGGRGIRMMPLTERTPKPMLPIGGKPMLETILRNFMSHGFRDFYLCVNYLSSRIKDYFGDGSAWDISIQYIEEPEPLGTAGALRLLPPIAEPVIVTNADILTKLNFSNLLAHHIQRKAEATMCVKEYEHQIPYGVIRTQGDQIVGLEEKPVHRFFVNAGIYVVNPSTWQEIPARKTYHITDLFSCMIANDDVVTSVFPVHEYWLDVGRMSDYEKAQVDYELLFRQAAA